MHTLVGHDIAEITSCLDDGTVHVWLFNYRRSQRRAPLLALLGSYLGLPSEAVMLVEGQHGRPELASPWSRFLQFNWSHSADKAIVAVARGVTPGIDIERLRPRPRAVALAERFFHPDESAALAALDEAFREHVFLQVWTGKEAVLKALGRGVAFGLDRLRLSVPPHRPGLLWLDGDDARQWQLQQLDVGAGYVASLAWRGPSRPVHIWTLAESV
jgi:4'-phosphopantetheinyl transferase